MRILIIEDDSEIRNSLAKFFTAELFVVDAVDTGSEATRLTKTYTYDIILLDRMLPDSDGNLLCKDIRNRKITTPILILSGIVDIESKLNLFESGADDYLVKPYSIRELYARVTALLRRPQKIAPSQLALGPFIFDFTNHLVKRSGQRIQLTRKEFCLLEYFVRNKDRVLSRNELLDHVWEMDVDIFSNTVETHIFNLRQKLSHKDSPIIQTISGKGYRLTIE